MGTVIIAVSGVIRSLAGRDGLGADPRLPSQLIHYFLQQEGSSTLKQLYSTYQDTPILVAHSDCFGPGCHQVYYSTRMSAAGDHIIHSFSASPRHNASNIHRRGDWSGDDSGAGNDGGLYGVYSFINYNPKMRRRKVCTHKEIYFYAAFS